MNTIKILKYHLFLILLGIIAIPIQVTGLETFTHKLTQSTSSYDFWTTLPSERVLKTDATPVNMGTRISVYSAKNEFEPFLLVVKPTTTSTASVTIGDFGTGISTDLYQVKYVNITTASDSQGATGLYPDPLWPIQNGESVTITAGENTTFWCSIKVADSVPAGDYTTSITVNGVDIPVQLHVFDFAIPGDLHVKSQMNLAFNTLIAKYSIPSPGTPAESAQYWAFVDKVKQFFIDHRLTPKATLWPGSLTYNGVNPSPDYDCLNTITDNNGIFGFELPAERYLGGTGLMDSNFSDPFNDGNGFPIFLAASYTNNDPSQDQRPDELCSISRTASDGPVDTNMTTTYNQKFLQYISALEAYLDTTGFLNKAYYHIASEPIDQDDIDTIAWYAHHLKSNAPDLKLMVTGPPEPEIFNHATHTNATADIWLCLFDQFNPSLSFTRDRDYNEETWVYYYRATKPPYANPITLDHPGIESKLTGWFLWKYRIRGLGYYAMNDWGANPWTTPLSGSQNGAAFLLYPPSETNTNIPYGSNENRLVPSIRMELMRDSLEDYEYLYVLNSNALPVAGTANSADSQVNRLISGMSGFTRDSEFLYNMRKEIGMVNGNETATIPDLTPTAKHDRPAGDYYINFQDPAGEPLDDPLVVDGKTYLKIGWDDYDQAVGYGWYGDPTRAAEAYLSSGSDKRQRSILYDDAGHIKTFEFDIPAGTYIVTVSAGWEGRNYEHNHIAVEGVQFFDDEANNGDYLIETHPVTIYDNKLTMEMGIAGEFTMLNYMKIETADLTAPVITLIGDTTINLFVGDTYTEPGATATDDIDGDISSAVSIDSSGVNMSAAGTYTVTYTVSDAAGNTAQESRTIVVTEQPVDENPDTSSENGEETNEAPAGGSGGGGGCFIQSIR